MGYAPGTCVRGRAVCLVGLLLCGCQKPPVTWSDVVYSQEIPERGTGAKLEVPDSAACVSTVRHADIPGEIQTVWWSIRPDSSAVLRYSSSTNADWQPVITVDTTDRSRMGCNRPAPAIAADREGRLYVAYFLEQATGPGIFFVHRMDAAGFHDPVSIAYGKRPSEVSVAAEGDRVVVAYEEPNAERGQIWVALSGSMGHLFEYRGPVSGASELSRHPEIQLHGTKLEVSWLELIQSDSSGRTRRAHSTGTWK